MNRSHREPTLDEILSDSIVRALMEADGVDRQDPRGDAVADGLQAGPASRFMGTAVHARSPLCHSITSLSH
jgi:hypothetical protein